MSFPPNPESSEMLPLFPLGTVLLPGMTLSLHVFEPRYRQLVSDLLKGGPTGAPEFGVVALRQGSEVGGRSDDVYEIGTTALITDVVPLPDGRCTVAAVGRRRFAIQSLDSTSRPYLRAEVSYLFDNDTETPDADLVEAVLAVARRHLGLLDQLGVDDVPVADLPTDAGELAYAMARQPGLMLADRQAILAAPSTSQRLRTAKAIVGREVQLIRNLHAIPARSSTFINNT